MSGISFLAERPIRRRLMSPSRALALGIFLGACSLMSLPAQDKEPKRELSLEQVRQLALDYSPSLRKARLAEDASDASLKLAALNAGPALSTSASGGYGVADSNYADGGRIDLSLGLSASMSIYDGGQGTLGVSLAKLAKRGASVATLQAYSQVVSAADSAYYGLLQAKANLDAAQEDLTSSNQAFTLATAKFAGGTATQLEVLEAESNLRAKEAALSQAGGDFMVARIQLESLTGIEGDYEIGKVDFETYSSLIASLAALGDPEIKKAIGKLEEKTKRDNLSLQAAMINLETAKGNLSLTKAAYQPQVKASLSPQLAWDTSDLSLQASVSLSASLDLNLWKSPLAISGKAKAVEQSRQDQIAAERELAVSLRTAVYSCIAKARQAIASQTALDYASSYYEKCREMYTLATYSSQDLYSAQASLSSSRLSLIKAQFAFLSSLSELSSLSAYSSDAELVGALTSR